MLALCAHLGELEGRWRDVGLLGVANVVRVIGGTEVGLVDAFQHRHGRALQRIVVNVFEGLRPRLDRLGLKLWQEHRLLKGTLPLTAVPLRCVGLHCSNEFIIIEV